MKNLFFAATAVAILAMTSSCQKEEVIPNSTAGEAGILAVPPNPNAGGPVLEDWNFCETDVQAYRETADNGRRMLTILDETEEVWYIAEWIDATNCPTTVTEAVEAYHPGLIITEYWQTVYPSNELFVLESEWGNGEMFVLFVTHGGAIKCKGFH